LRDVFCFDIGSGGFSAARFDEHLIAREYREVPWQLPLTAAMLQGAFDTLMNALQSGPRPAAISISSFMHSFLVSDENGNPKTPLHTWMDSDSREGIDAIRHAIGSEFHRRTGCRMHPMFPVFKLATMKLGPKDRVISPKSFLVQKLTGRFVDDLGMAAASGLLNAHSADWDADILRAAQLSVSNLPQLEESHAIVGNTAQDVPVVNGSGDGFMANIGSGCETSGRIAITIGTSAAARQMLPSPRLDDLAGTFCYRGLLGCASSNGGNALDWARAEFGVSNPLEVTGHDIPIFMPWLNGERSLEWNPDLRPQWNGRSSRHTPDELFRAVMEGVLFNLAQYVEVIEGVSGIRANEIVLSGNGFLDPAVAPILAALVSRPTLLPEASGMGTLRGTALCAWRALGHDASASLDKILERATRVVPINDEHLLSRFSRFKEIREFEGRCP